MADLKERMRQEAIARMASLDLHPTVIDDFKNRGKRYVSIEGRPYLTVDSPGVIQFEVETGYIIYHIIYNHTTIGDMLTFLYVSNNPEEWEMEKKGLEKDEPLAYVVNLENAVCSEFGSVKIQKHLGGLIRII